MLAFQKIGEKLTMPAGNTVRPQRWSNVIDLYDDGDYAAIWGSFDGNRQRCLGVRWNGGPSEPGYPSQGGNPLWFVEPEFVARAKASVDRTSTRPSTGEAITDISRCGATASVGHRILHGDISSGRSVGDRWLHAVLDEASSA